MRPLDEATMLDQMVPDGGCERRSNLALSPLGSPPLIAPGFICVAEFAGLELCRIDAYP